MVFYIWRRGVVDNNDCRLVAVEEAQNKETSLKNDTAAEVSKDCDIYDFRNYDKPKESEDS